MTDPRNGGPEILGIEPDPATPGTEVVIEGISFGARGTVTFDPAAPDLGPVAGTIVSWGATTIVVRVPPMESLRAGGRTYVRLTNGAGASAATVLWVLETSPPAITSLSRSVGVHTEELRVLGRGFGVDASGSGVVFRTTAADAGVAATVAQWGREDIAVVIPDPAALGGPGLKRVTVETGWGASNTVDFTIAERPAITGVSPGAAPPDALVTVTGRAFGSSAGSMVLRDPAWGASSGVPMELLSWAPTEIRAFVPGLPALQVTGDKELVVRVAAGSSAPAPLRVLEIGSVTAWARIEPHSRAPSPEEGLEVALGAEIADGLWLLARQWVLGELQATDGGSPVVSIVDGESAPLVRWRPRRSGTPGALPGPGAPPLEAVVERERIFPVSSSAGSMGDWRLAADAGQQFLRHLAARVTDPAQAAAYRRGFIDAFPLALPPQAERRSLDDASLRFLVVVAGRVPDGGQLYHALRPTLPPAEGGRSQLPPRPPIREADRAAVLDAVSDWFRWCALVVDQPGDGEEAWERDRMEYTFAVSAETSAGEVVLSVPEYVEGHLDWHAFVRTPGLSLRASNPPAPVRTPITATAVPAPVTYPGMPAPRWWEMEDARVDFAGLRAGATDLLRMLFVEFATVFSNDWFVVPVDGVAAGSVLRLSALRVRDTFNVEVTVPPFTRTAPGAVFRMFQLSAPDGSAAPELLLLPPSLPASIQSAPLEEVLLLRDETANMAWAVERTVASAIGRPLDRHEAYQAQLRREERERASQPPRTRPPGVPDIAYRLTTGVPPQWIPLVPVGQGARMLLRAAMPREDPDGVVHLVQPEGRVLEPLVARLELFDEEVPREGARIVRNWQLARGPDGTRHLWIGRRKAPGRGEGSSGLRFDVVETNPPPAPVAPASSAPPTVSGEARVGRTLSVSPGAWTGTEPITYAYQWRRILAGDGAPAAIAGATGASYVAAPADAGSTLDVVVTASNAAGTASAASAPTGVVAALPTPPANTAPPTVAGRAASGQPLVAVSTGTWSGTPPFAFTYQWRRTPSGGGSPEDIAGATEATYVPVAADVASTLQVVVTASNEAGSASAASAPTGPVGPALAPPAPISPPTILGRPFVLQQLLAQSPGTWAGAAPLTFSYQWRRCDAAGSWCRDIPGAAGDRYQLSAADEGSTIRVAVTARNEVGSVVASSEATAIIGPPIVPPSNTAVPTISGRAVRGQTLSAAPGTWSGTPPFDYAYQWERVSASGSVAAIPNANGPTYSVVAADVGSALGVAVTAANPAGSASARSAPTAAVTDPPTNTAPPTISGRGAPNQTLTAAPGTWSGTSPLAFSYQWQRCNASGEGCTDIVEARHSTYQVTTDDIGFTIRLVVTASNVAGSATAPSAPVLVSGRRPGPENTRPPSISGRPYVGSVLSANEGQWSGPRPLTFAFQWLRCDANGAQCVPISGATERTYVPHSGDVVLPAEAAGAIESDLGRTLRVEVTATSPAGSASAASAPTRPVTREGRPRPDENA